MPYKIFFLVMFAATPHVSIASPYDALILGRRPVLYLQMGAPLGSSYEPDRARRRFRGRYLPQGSTQQKTQLPNGDIATVFNGVSEYLELGSSGLFSIPTRGALTIEAWIRPDTLNFPREEGSGYVHWAGKGEAGQHEYALRMYSLTNEEGRPNRVSGYVFNLQGGLGSGSYFQDPVGVGEWIHVAVVVDTNISPAVISIYKNGLLRKSTPLSQFQVIPQVGNAPLRIGTRDRNSYFKGAIGKFAIYSYALDQAKLREHFLRMTSP